FGEPALVCEAAPFVHPIGRLAAADAGVDQNGVMAGAHQIALHWHDKVTRGGVKRPGLKPVAVWCERLGSCLVKEADRREDWFLKLDNSVDADVAQRVRFHASHADLRPGSCRMRVAQRVYDVLL